MLCYPVVNKLVSVLTRTNRYYYSKLKITNVFTASVQQLEKITMGSCG